MATDRDAECKQDVFSSRTCERGTDSCTVRHGESGDGGEIARLAGELAEERMDGARLRAEVARLTAELAERHTEIACVYADREEAIAAARLEGARVEREACAKSLLALSRDPLTSRQMDLVAGILAAVEHIRARSEGGPGEPT